MTKQLGKVQKTTEEQEMARLNAERFVERLQQSVEEKNAKEETIKNEAVSQRRALLGKRMTIRFLWQAFVKTSSLRTIVF